MPLRAFLAVACAFLPALLLPALFLPVWAAVAEEHPLRARFEALCAAGDPAGLQAFWREHPDQALAVIDSYLEGSLAAVEEAEAAGRPPDVQAIARMHALALQGARAADAAFGRVIFTDYSSAFVGWNRDEQKRFRAGQQAFGEARAELKKSSHAAAQAAAQRCLELARPLGDWWGAAMGLTVLAAALEQLGELEPALARLAEARLLHQALGLAASELKNLQGMARLLVALDRRARAAVVIETGLAQAALSQDPGARLPFLQQRALLEERRGEAEAAARTRAELEALRPKPAPGKAGN